MPVLFFPLEAVFIMCPMLTYLRPYMFLQMLITYNKHYFYCGYTAVLFHFNNIQMQFCELGQRWLFYRFTVLAQYCANGIKNHSHSVYFTSVNAVEWGPITTGCPKAHSDVDWDIYKTIGCHKLLACIWLFDTHVANIELINWKHFSSPCLYWGPSPQCKKQGTAKHLKAK